MRALLFSATLIGALAPAAASAAIVYSATATLNRAVNVNDDGIETMFDLNGGGTTYFYGPGNLGRSVQDNVVIADVDGGFFYKHDVQAYGNAQSSLDTTVTVTIRNTDLVNSAEAQRFDSEIIPGHLGVLTSSAGVGNQLATTFFDVNLDGISKYSAAAILRPDSVSLFGQFVNLNALSTFETVGARAVDWSTTNIHVDLGTFAPGQEKVLTYRSRTIAQLANARFQCPTVEVCGAAQAVFGDPRRVGQSSRSAARAKTRYDPIVGQQFGRFESYARVVDATSDLPPEPDRVTPPNYAPAVATPEPAVAALLGLGALALAVRRRR